MAKKKKQEIEIIEEDKNREKIDFKQKKPILTLFLFLFNAWLKNYLYIITTGENL